MLMIVLAGHDPDIEAGHSCDDGGDPDDISNPSEQSDVRGRDAVDHECFVASVRAQEFNEWRNIFSVSMAKQRCRKVRRSFSCGIFSSGGLFCIMSAIRSGFTPRWGTEIDGKMARMWTDLTGTPCLGDTFKQNFRRQPRVVYLKSGQPCPDFSSSHAGGLPPGSDGDTGWQFVAQVDQICALRPDAFCLEMVANSIRVNDRAEVSAVVELLSDEYHVHASVLRVASYGDCSNRQRLFIIGFNKETVGSVGAEFAFPAPEFDDSYFFTAIEILQCLMRMCLSVSGFTKMLNILQRTLTRSHCLFTRLVSSNQAWDHHGIHMLCRLTMAYILHRPLTMVGVGGCLWVGKKEMR